MSSSVPTKAQAIHSFALPPLHGGGGGGSERAASRQKNLEKECKRHAKNSLVIQHDTMLKGLHSKQDKEGSDKNSLIIHDHVVEENEEKQSSDHVFNVNDIDKKTRSKILIKIFTSIRNTDKNVVDKEQDLGLVNEDKGEDDEPMGKIWNLRPRKQVKKSLNVDLGRGEGGVGLKSGGRSGIVHEKKDQRLNGVEKEKKAKFSISLTRQEIEEDIYSFTGSKVSRRPRKRLKLVQKNLDMVFPGQWLASITPHSYKV